MKSDIIVLLNSGYKVPGLPVNTEMEQYATPIHPFPEHRCI
jgi:hypothetical protein